MTIEIGSPLSFVVVLLSVMSNVVELRCPISPTQCSTIQCIGTTISCENDISVTRVPTITSDNTISSWTQLVIRNTNIKQIERVSFQAFTANNSIILVDLSNNQIELVEQDAFLQFTFLRKLILTNNKLQAFQLDSYLAVRLDQLYLDNNFIANFTVNTADSNAPFTTQLTNLYLNQNKLAILPIDIKQLNSLTYLDLSYNPIVNLPRYSFSTLTSLTTLQLNGLEVLRCLNVDTFIGLDNLINLYLSAPIQIGLLPDRCWFSHLSSLKEFLYNTTYLLLRQQSTVNLQTYDYCMDKNNACWLYILTVLKKLLVRDPVNAQTVSFCVANETLIPSIDACISDGCSLATCDAGSYENSNSLTTTTTRSPAITVGANNNLAVILGSVFAVVFFLLVVVFISCLCLIRKKKLCFKDANANAKKLDLGTNSTVNPLFLGGKNNKAFIDSGDDDDDFNNIGAIVNIVELSDNSASNFDNSNNEVALEAAVNRNVNVRFNSNVLVIKNNADNSILTTSQEESDMIETIYEDDEDEDEFGEKENADRTLSDANNNESLNSNDVNDTRL